MRLKPNTVLAITGPTASGKTALSLAIASVLGMRAEIISADSRQIYKGLDIGTAKPTPMELAQIPHHFIDICEPDESYNAGKFAKDAQDIIASLLQRNILPIIVGGSGLYVQALCEGFFDMPTEMEQAFMDARVDVQEAYQHIGKDALFEELRRVDPQSCNDYPDKNPRRVMRALEFHKATGKRFSEEKSAMMKHPTFNTIYVMIDHERSELYARINQRCEEMWDGMVNETRTLIQKGLSQSAQSFDTVGYAQAISFLNGEIDREIAIEEMKQATRHYAKRQITWSKRVDGMILLQGDIIEMAHKSLQLLNADA